MFHLKKHLLFDGAMGTLLQESGLPAGTPPEKMNLTAPEAVEKIHAAYKAAGSDILTANTFGASRRKLGEDPAPCIAAGIAAARRAAGNDCSVALDVGPLGALLEPFGEMSFEEAYGQFAEIMESGEKAGADLVLIETMSDLLEVKAALLAAKERTALPVFVTMTFGEDADLSGRGSGGSGGNADQPGGRRHRRELLRRAQGAAARFAGTRKR